MSRDALAITRGYYSISLKQTYSTQHSIEVMDGAKPLW